MCFIFLNSCQYSSHNLTVPDPLQQAIENPQIKHPSGDIADEEETPGPLSQILLAPAPLAPSQVIFLLLIEK